MVGAPSTGPHWVAQHGGVLGVVLAVDQHQRGPLVGLNHVANAAEVLEGKKTPCHTSTQARLAEAKA